MRVLAVALAVMTALYLHAALALQDVQRLRRQCVALQRETLGHVYQNQPPAIGWQDFDRKRPT